MNTIGETIFVIYEGYLREVVGQFNGNLIIDDGGNYILIPDRIYPKINLADLTQSN